MNLRPWIALAGAVAVGAIVVGLMQFGGGGEQAAGSTITTNARGAPVPRRDRQGPGRRHVL